MGIHPKHVEQFTEIKKSCVTLHLVGHTLEYIYDTLNLKRPKWEQCCSMQAGRHNGRTDTQTVGMTDRETDMASLIVAFSNSVNSPKNCKWNSTIKFQASVQYITLALV